MAKKIARSARGRVIDFDLLLIKQQLAKVPVPVNVDQRRKFIDEKDGIRTREFVKTTAIPQPAQVIPSASVEKKAEPKTEKQPAKAE